MSTTRRVFPEVFKREAVDRVISSGLPVGKVATELGLNETVLRRWVVRRGGQATGPGRRPMTQASVASPSDLAAANARLRRENERLRMERDQPYTFDEPQWRLSGQRTNGELLS